AFLKAAGMDAIRVKSGLGGILLAALWVAAAGGGSLWLIRDQMTPGKPADLAAAQAIPPAMSSTGSGRPTLLMFLHPQCPCSRARVEELAHLMTRCRDRLCAKVFVFASSQESPAWSHTDLWRAASAIDGVTVTEDVDGLLAQQMGAQTSGQTFLLDAH